MDFIEEDRFVRYRIVCKNPQMVAKITLERINNLDVSSSKANIGKEVIMDKEGLHIQSFYSHFYKPEEQIRRRISSDTPYAIGLGREYLSNSTIWTLDSDKREYLAALINMRYTERLANVLHSDSIDTLYRIIETLGSNPEVLEAFYREYQHDFIALRELIPLFELVEIGSVPVEEKKSTLEELTSERSRIVSKLKLDTRHPRTSNSNYPYAKKELDAINQKIGDWPLAAENTEVEKLLNLEFNKVRH